jgi:hypothetical protein
MAVGVGEGDGASDFQVTSGLLEAGEDGLLAPLCAEQTGAQDDEGEHGRDDDERDQDDRRLQARDAFLFLVQAAKQPCQLVHSVHPPWDLC